MDATSTIFHTVLPASWASLTELANVLGVHPSTVFRWAGKGVRGRRLPTTKIGGRTGVTPEDLERFIRALNEPLLRVDGAQAELPLFADVGGGGGDAA